MKYQQNGDNKFGDYSFNKNDVGSTSSDQERYGIHCESGRKLLRLGWKGEGYGSYLAEWGG